MTTAGGQGCIPGHGVVLSGPSGVIASSLSEGTDYGSDLCPWSVRAQPGQRINITLVNFARAPNPMGEDVDDADAFLPGPRICYQFAVIKERDARRSVTECEGGPREVKAYMSSSHQVDITVLSRKSSDTFFLLKYEGRYREFR